MRHDLNPIVNLQQELKRVYAREPSNINELETYCHEEWQKLPQNICTNLVVNYKECLLEVIYNKGFYINYINRIVRTILSCFFFVMLNYLCISIKKFCSCRNEYSYPKYVAMIKFDYTLRCVE